MHIYEMHGDPTLRSSWSPTSHLRSPEVIMRRKIALLAIVSLMGLASACAGITSPTQDGDDDGDGRCQVVQGSSTRCSTEELPN